MFTKGYIKLWRGIQDNHLYFSKEFCPTMAWIDLLLLANFKSHTTYIRGIPIEVKAGQVLASLGFLGSRWKWSPNKVKRYLKYLSSENVRQISIVKSNVCTILTILNWEMYQGNGEEIDTQTTRRSNADDTQTKSKRHADENTKELQELQEGQEENTSVLASPKKGKQAPSDSEENSKVPHKAMNDTWNDLCKKSGLRKCYAWPSNEARIMWDVPWFRNNWKFIFWAVHQNEWCKEHHYGVDHVLRRKNARRYFDEISEHKERLYKQGYTYNSETETWYKDGKPVM
jgi:hypothetical protein